MTPAQMAHLYARCFPHERGWSSEEFDRFAQDPKVVIESIQHGFAILRIVADEGELLSIAIDPNHQKRGHATRLFQKLLDHAANRGATTLFLEVAGSNAAAIAAYLSWGFTQVGLRKGYYLRDDGGREDALILRRSV